MILDISIELSPQMVRWEGDPPMLIRQVLQLSKGDPYNLSEMKLSLHQGTHLDAPHHFLENGDFVENFPLDLLVGEAQVIVIPDSVSNISSAVLRQAGIQPGIRRLLFKTRNSQYWKNDPYTFHSDFVSLSLDGTDYLIERGIRLVGIDYLSISPADDFRPVHARLMEKKIAILETLDLSEVEGGPYTLVCLPLKVKAVEGAPVRAVLLRD